MVNNLVYYVRNEVSVTPSRDPLSPYLFLLCAEAFSSMVRKAETDGTIKGVVVSRREPRASHLLFANDTLIFCQATQETLMCVKRILSIYESASSLMINNGKSRMVFSKNMDANSCTILANILGVVVVPKHDKYLSLPKVVGRSHKEVFDGIKERIWQKLHKWSSKQLSQAGLMVLIKTVLQALPTYVIYELFSPSDTLLSETERMMADFFWSSEVEIKIH
ncbi:UNVERIFIED_CONTAM: hypothetical protein Slati_0232800 [Sesamum latifolium]|uniref:Reverse transcriptase domain-containing protein n=1 Tax=Sesamum latifolium TaxID=2727402 RepID=A0AAW2YCC5_9LAMI